ncbi:MAG TPA: hypothetical protein VFB59_04635 [Candidatus Saccharimonadales bacterium]|nr:hypothetical protein [Candidatus Saccharimonadales bacterium]
MFKKILQKIREITPKQLVVAGVFTLALAGSIGLGLAHRQSVIAEEVRDCDNGGSIINVSPCGALTPQEFVADIRANNSQQKDLQTIYADPRLGGLQGEDDYNRFASEARPGILKRNGEVWVDGELVMTNAYTMGRKNYAGRESITIGNTTYYMSTPNVSFAAGRQQLDVMVLFDKNGAVEFAVIEACGNAIPKGEKRTPSITCKALNKIEVSGKKNTYKFNTTVEKDQYGLAKVTKVEYYIDGKLWKTETDPAKTTDEYTFTKSADVSVKVYYDVPGGPSNKGKVIESINCKQHIEVEVPFYACEKLVATARDESNRKFRFTVNAKFGNGATLKNADFSIDGVTKNTGVTQKDAQGNIYQDYDFNDNIKHTIVAKVNFNVADKVESKLCQAEVTPTKKPMCPLPGKEQYPPDAPECKEKPQECKPGVPIGHPDCAPLPKTGPGSVAGLFAGVSIAGSAAHRLFLRYRSRREQ